MTVEAFPLYQLNDIPNALRQLANKIDDGQVSAVRCVVALETDVGEIDYKAFGAEPFTVSGAIGICFAAANKLVPR